jgi:hypothetical protein
MVCHKISNGEVVFMPESCHDWKREGCQLSANLRIIKDHQIFSASSASGDHDRVKPS